MAQRIAVVTGAAGGMGRAITDRLTEDGLHVVGVDIDGPALLMMAADLSGFTPEAVDLTDADAIADLFDRITARFGGVDVLVNNAGTCFMSDFPDISSAELDRQMAVNFSSAFHCCQGAVKAMADRPGVRKIVNISSNGAYNFDVFDPPHYRASKAAM
ncbi:MAG: SDR family NAD(P)-dependent oxidoreductase, partial [Pseudomonadota bacterium]